jgi:hypothetical protein
MRYLLVVVVALLCISARRPRADVIPPGTVVVSDSLFVDVAPMRNLDYLEFLYWTKRIYGTQSATYRSILPDTSIWLNADSTLHQLRDTYLRHPVYRNCPVVGVSRKQAELFAKWRTDRVAEFILIQQGILDWDPGADSTTCFKLDDYLKGMQQAQNVAAQFPSFPVYTLPDTADIKIITSFAERQHHKKKSKSGYSNTVKVGTQDVNLPFEYVKVRYDKKLKELFVEGTLPELTRSGLWEPQSRSVVADSPAFTGFRCVCRKMRN